MVRASKAARGVTKERDSMLAGIRSCWVYSQVGGSVCTDIPYPVICVCSVVLKVWTPHVLAGLWEMTAVGGSPFVEEGTSSLRLFPLLVMGPADPGVPCC
jgi:hypothetical protein